MFFKKYLVRCMFPNPSVMVFDIETVPDVQAGRRIHALENLNDLEVVEALFAMQRNKNGSEFLPHFLQKIVAISIVLAKQDSIAVWSLGDAQATEAELITRFYAGIDKHVPILVSWNGTGFDLPVLHYRSLVHGICASRYWEQGNSHNDFKWNNYISRYHQRHLDLMDVLSGYQ